MAVCACDLCNRQSASTTVEVLKHGYFNSPDCEPHQFPITLLRLTPHSGRRHQLRLHMAEIGHPIVGDATYAAHRSGNMVSATPIAATSIVDDASVVDTGVVPALVDIAPRMMLHAWRLTLPFHAVSPALQSRNLTIITIMLMYFACFLSQKSTCALHEPLTLVTSDPFTEFITDCPDGTILPVNGLSK